MGLHTICGRTIARPQVRRQRVQPRLVVPVLIKKCAGGPGHAAIVTDLVFLHTANRSGAVAIGRLSDPNADGMESRA